MLNSQRLRQKYVHNSLLHCERNGKKGGGWNMMLRNRAMGGHVLYC
jgi:hypothetical protein